MHATPTQKAIVEESFHHHHHDGCFYFFFFDLRGLCSDLRGKKDDSQMCVQLLKCVKMRSFSPTIQYSTLGSAFFVGSWVFAVSGYDDDEDE